jgi:hypothetical protein
MLLLAKLTSKGPIPRQMPDRASLVALPFEDAGEVVVGVGILRIEIEGAAIGVRCLL